MHRLSVARASALRPPIHLLAGTRPLSTQPLAAAAAVATGAGSGPPLPFMTLVEMQEK